MAAELGVSVATVSLALRNDSQVSPATRMRIQAAATERGYRLNPALTQMMSQVRKKLPGRYSETLGWLNLSEAPERFSESGLDYLRFMWEGARDRAAEQGYGLDHLWLGERGMSAKRLQAILQSRGIRGVLIPPLQRSIGHISLDWQKFAAVALTHTMPRPRLHRVVPDHHANMRQILRRLSRKGYRRPGLLLPRKFDERGDNRCSSAFYFHQQNLTRENRIPLLETPSLRLDSQTARWLKKYRPDAIITVGALRHLRQVDIGDAAYSRSLGIVLLGHASTDAGFAAVQENPEEIGAAGVNQLLSALSRNERGIPDCPQTILIPGTWVEGTTLPKRPSGAR